MMTMNENNQPSGPIDVAVRQDGETGVREIVAGHFRLRYLYARSSDCRQSNDPGQDYIALRQDGRRLVFALCDGVSQSFYGDLAARFLGDALVEWLWNVLPSNELQQESVRQALHGYLTDLTDAATRLVRQVPIPADAPSLLRDALEQKRAIGSEATFVCGSIEMPGPDLPQGRVVLAWLGDAELQLWGKERDRTGELGAEWIEARRWSTKIGPKGGPIGVFIGRLEGVRRVLAYSDGIASLRERLGRGIDDSELAREVERLGEMPTSDDVSFLEIEVLPEPLAASISVTVPAEVVRPPQATPLPPHPMPIPPVEAPPPAPHARPWLVYAGAVAAFAALCLVASLAGWPIVKKRMVAPSPTTRPLPAAATTRAVKHTPVISPTATPSQSPLRTPQPESPLPTPVTPTVLPQTPASEMPHQLSRVPPRVAPIDGESTLPEGAMVVVGGMKLNVDERGLYHLRVAQRGGVESVLSFPHQGLPPGFSLDQVQWVWLIYRSQVSSGPVIPVLLTLVLKDGRELPWGPVNLQEEQETWAFGVNSSAGLCHFITQGCPVEELDASILVKGSWHHSESGWQLQATEWYRFDPRKSSYVPVE